MEELVSFSRSYDAITDWCVGMIFEEIGTFQQQTDLYKQKLGFECRQSGPITFQN